MEIPAPRLPRRVVVADDHTFYRDGLVGLLEDSGIDVVADVATGEAALVAVADTDPDVVVMDMNMPGIGGIEATRLLRVQSPRSQVVLLTVSQEEEHVLSGILAGARGFVLKDGAIEDVVRAIEDAARGRTRLSARVSARLLDHVRGSDARRGLVFTDREVEVLARLAEGGTTDEVAARARPDGSGRAPHGRGRRRASCRSRTAARSRSARCATGSSDGCAAPGRHREGRRRRPRACAWSCHS